MFDRINKGIYWDRSWKLVEGCTPVSEACRNCWSARETLIRRHHPNPKISARLKGLTSNRHFNGKIRLRTDNLLLPAKTRKPTVFAIWNDFFHKKVPFEFIAAAFGIMAWADQHVYLVLTKRPERMLEWFKWIEKQTIKHFIQPHPALKCAFHATKFEVPHKILLALSDKADSLWPLPNVWLGVTAENQSTANERIPLLLQIPAVKRFVSIEPMLGPVELAPDHIGGYPEDYEWFKNGKPPLDWIILGGETGPRARPMHPNWVRLVRDECKMVGIPFFFKGWGEWVPIESDEDDFTYEKGWRKDVVMSPDGRYESHRKKPLHRGTDEVLMRSVGRKNAGAILDGKEYREVPR